MPSRSRRSRRRRRSRRSRRSRLTRSVTTPRQPASSLLRLGMLLALLCFPTVVQAASSSSSSRLVKVAGGRSFGGRERRSLLQQRVSLLHRQQQQQQQQTQQQTQRRSKPRTNTHTKSPLAAILPGMRESLQSWKLQERRLLTPPLAVAVAASTLTASSATAKGRTSSRRSKDVSSANNIPKENTDMDLETALQELGPVGKVVAGTVEIAMSTLLEFLSGLLGGYALGIVTGIPAFLTKTDPAAAAAFGAQVGARTLRMHAKAGRWGKQWGSVSAAFGGFRVTTKVLRGGKEDEWSTVFSSMAAGAYFARQDGPTAMVRGAVMYGGLVYLLSGNMFEKKQPFEYTEEKLDF